MDKRLVITIDGPAGAGKSTVSKALAAKLSLLYLDSGAIYRAFAYCAHQEGIRPDDDEKLAIMGRSLSITLRNRNGQMLIFINGKKLAEGLLRSEQISLLSSTFSARPCVREALLEIQRKAGSRGGIVAEGRDMGTVVFPKADFKFFLDATLSERVKRRYREVAGRNSLSSYTQVENDLVIRDRQDSERSIAPLCPAPDAMLIDSTRMSVEDVVYKMMELILHRNRNL